MPFERQLLYNKNPRLDMAFVLGAWLSWTFISICNAIKRVKYDLKNM